MLVVAGQDPQWGPRVADRNASGRRTALLVLDDPDTDPTPLAEAMAAEVFAGADWTLVDARQPRA